MSLKGKALDKSHSQRKLFQIEHALSPASISSVLSLPLLVLHYPRGLYEGRDILYNHVQEYGEGDIVEISDEPKQRAATGRVLTGDDCEFIKLCSLTANDDCIDGE